MNNKAPTINLQNLTLKDKALIIKLKTELFSSFRYRLNREYVRFIQKASYSHFITIEFQYDFSFNQKVEYFNKLLHFVNRSLFGKNYLVNDEYLRGFLFAEKHKTGEYHFHILITDDSNVNECKKNICDVFNKLLPKVTSNKGRSGYRIFGGYSVRVDNVYYNDGVVRYSTKGVWSSNGASVFPLSKTGISITALDS